MDGIKKLIEKLENIKENAQKLNGTHSIEILSKTDEDGFIDKECPEQNCLFPFKVYGEDWKTKIDENKVYCPNCKNESPSNAYFPEKLVKQVQNKVIKQARESLLSGEAFPQKFLPFQSTKKWNLKIECEECTLTYSVIGSAFFCPCCGYNSIEKYFDDSIRKVKIKIESIEKIKTALTGELGVDDAEVVVKSIKETSLTDIVVSFQHFSNLIYRKITEEEPKFNVFQRINEGSQVWKSKIDEGYEDWITTDQITLMNKMFQQRHLFSHSDGIVDEKYIDRSQDESYRVGQRVVLNENEITELVEIVLKITDNLKEHVG